MIEMQESVPYSGSPQCCAFQYAVEKVCQHPSEKSKHCDFKIWLIQEGNMREILVAIFMDEYECHVLLFQQGYIDKSHIIKQNEISFWVLQYNLKYEACG